MISEPDRTNLVKNVPPSINSTQLCRQQFPFFFFFIDTQLPTSFCNEHTLYVLYKKSRLVISYLLLKLLTKLVVCRLCPFRQFYYPQRCKVYTEALVVIVCMEYGHHIEEGGFTKAGGIKSFSLHCLLLNFCRNAASLAVFYCHFHGYCFSELASCIPPYFPLPRCTAYFFSFISAILFLFQ